MGRVAFATLEKLARICTSISVAVPAASIYTFYMFIYISWFRSTGGKRIAAMILVPVNSGLQHEA